MNKIKKIIIAIIVGLIAILGINTTANAYYVGQSLTVSFGEYSRNQNIYCAEHHQALRSVNAYTIISQVRIEGNKSTDHAGNTQTSWHNAKMAYILNANNGDRKNGPVANAVWNYLYTWLRSVGQYHEGLYSSFSNGVQGSPTWLDTESSNYANSLQNSPEEVKDNTNNANIKVVPYDYEGKSYMRVGPFNWSFTGNMKSVRVDDQNGNAIQGISFSSFNGNNEYWYNADGIKSGRDFYVTIPMSTEITKITKLTAQTTTTVKGVNIWFLKAKASYKQNLIIREPYEVPVDITTPLEYDISTQGNLKAIKVNKDNQEVKLVGVGFYIQHKNTGKYVNRAEDGKITYVNTREEATEFITDQNGEIQIENLIVGTYVAYETKNPNYGYEMITEGIEKEVVVDKTSEVVIPNKQIYVKLSGYVWVDKGDGKVSQRNDLYKTQLGEELHDNNDILFNGITVRLKDRTTGETIQETVTSKLDRYQDSINDGNGEYLFMDVLIEKLQNYYIEFQYDGITYTNVVAHLERDTGSKAGESGEERENFNKNFTTVEGRTRNTGYTTDANGNEKYQLTYNIDEAKHQATLINNGQYAITANTDVPDYRIRNHFTYGQEEVKYINLGLYERNQPNLAIMKDLENVRVTVNGYEHTYVYAQRWLNQGEYGDGFNVGVKFGSKYGSMSYTRAIYKSDYDYINENDKSKELKVYVTYKISMKNNSNYLVGQINSIVDYYDSNYEIVKLGKTLGQRDEVVAEDITHTKEVYNDKYKKTVITTNTRLDPEKQEDIYIEFALNREAVLNLINDKANLDNVVEINSYSTYEGDKIYAGIDENSAPANSIPGETRTYEDDTDASPSLKLEVADARELTGKVFLDETTGELMTGQVRQGSGEYEEGEKGIEGVDITLTENTGSGKVYTTKTDANGDFLITGYIPGDYTLTYTWGDKTYTVQNYKGTIYKNQERQNNKNWYKENVQTRLNDATDNYQTRQEIDEEIKNLTNKTQATKDKMDSTTPTMGISVEYETTYTASMGDKYIYRIENVDFGIVERAKQEISLNKRVKALRAVLPNGQVLVNATIEEDENGNRVLMGDINNITYMPPNPNGIPGNGFIRLEMDNEMMQGTRIEVEYEIKATNQSELDYLSENFYKYGTIEGEVVTIAPTGIIDYLGKDWAVDTEKSSHWQVKTLDEIKNMVSNEVYTSDKSTIAEKTILYTEALKEPKLKPLESSETMLDVSKILTTTDDISLDNEAEIVSLSKTGGSETISTPGNYIPGTIEKGEKVEADSSMAETTIVTPATGEDQNYIIPVMIGVTTLIILGVGIIVIKKKAI